jgi:hypothetical protein
LGIKIYEIECYSNTVLLFGSRFYCDLYEKDFKAAKDFGIAIINPKELLHLIGELP